MDWTIKSKTLSKPRKNTRKKGLEWVREVRKLLEAMNHVVEGPGYGVAFFNNRMSPIHRDYFSVFDLISFDGNSFIGHQVSDLSHKAEKVRAIQAKKMKGWIWSRFAEGRRCGYRLFFVDPEKVEEGEIIWRH